MTERESPVLDQAVEIFDGRCGVHGDGRRSTSATRTIDPMGAAVIMSLDSTVPGFRGSIVPPGRLRLRRWPAAPPTPTSCRAAPAPPLLTGAHSPLVRSTLPRTIFRMTLQTQLPPVGPLGGRRAMRFGRSRRRRTSTQTRRGLVAPAAAPLRRPPALFGLSNWSNRRGQPGIGRRARGAV